MEPLNDLFSNNIVEYYLIDDTLIKNLEKLKIKNGDNTKDVDTEDQTINLECRWICLLTIFFRATP